jgi:hypothetical protein
VVALFHFLPRLRLLSFSQKRTVVQPLCLNLRELTSPRGGFDPKIQAPHRECTVCVYFLPFDLSARIKKAQCRDPFIHRGSQIGVITPQCDESAICVLRSCVEKDLSAQLAVLIACKLDKKQKADAIFGSLVVFLAADFQMEIIWKRG